MAQQIDINDTDHALDAAHYYARAVALIGRPTPALSDDQVGAVLRQRAAANPVRFRSPPRANYTLASPPPAAPVAGRPRGDRPEPDEPEGWRFWAAVAFVIGAVLLCAVIA